MSVLEQARAEVVDALKGADLNAAEYVGELVQPPIALVMPDEPYVTTTGVRFGNVRVNLSVLLIGGRGTNRAAANALDLMIEAAYTALADDWDVTEVSQPGEVTLSGNSWLSAVVSITTETRL